MFLYISYSKLKQFFSVPFSPYSGIDYYKAKPNRTVIIISWISYDKMSDNSFIFIHSRERIEAS